MEAAQPQGCFECQTNMIQGDEPSMGILFHIKGQAKRELVNIRWTMDMTRNNIRRQIHHIALVDFVSLLETVSFHTVPT